MKLFENYINDLKYAMKELDDILSKNDIEYCILGGVALANYGYIRLTDDIDILVSKKDKHKISNLPIGYIRKINDRVLKLYEPDTKIEIIYSSEKAGNKDGIEYLEPILISQEDESTHAVILQLKYLIAYKISSGIYGNRLKDFGDVQELIIINKLKRNFLDSFRDDIKLKYYEIHDGTKHEN